MDKSVKINGVIVPILIWKKEKQFDFVCLFGFNVAL